MLAAKTRNARPRPRISNPEEKPGTQPSYVLRDELRKLVIGGWREVPQLQLGSGQTLETRKHGRTKAHNLLQPAPARTCPPPGPFLVDSFSSIPMSGEGVPGVALGSQEGTRPTREIFGDEANLLANAAGIHPGGGAESGGVEIPPRREAGAGEEAAPGLTAGMLSQVCCLSLGSILVKVFLSPQPATLGEQCRSLVSDPERRWTKRRKLTHGMQQIAAII